MTYARIAGLLALSAICGSCAGAPTETTSVVPPPPGSVAIVNGTLIDGTGAAPIVDAAVVVSSGRIVGVGPRAQVQVPAGAEVIDARGGTILPGFINAHVHDGFEPAHLRAWAQSGVTTVRDMEILSTTPGLLESLAAAHATTLRSPDNARLLMVGYILTAPGGYGRRYVATQEDARTKVEEELALGVEQIKFSLETGYGPLHDLPLLSSEQVAAIVETTHARGRRVTAHVTQGVFLRQVVESGADEAAHMPGTFVADDVIRRMVERAFIVVPTLTVHEAYGSLAVAQANLNRFVAAGGQVAMGNDYATHPAYGMGVFELGMPIHELSLMRDAGMTPMEVIVSATSTAARACGLEREVGTIELGKSGDVFVVAGDPLLDLDVLARALVVVHDGVIIRSSQR